MRTTVLILGLAAGLASTTLPADPAQAQRRAEHTPDLTFPYGGDGLQQIDFYRAETDIAGPAPLVIFVHGGGWRRGDKDMDARGHKAAFYPAQGYHYASINYRLLPQAPVEEQARDVARAIRILFDRAEELGIDRDRVVLSGHSAGAHLAALVGTDPQYLASVDLDHGDIAGIVPIDGAAYDVPRQMSGRKPLMGRIYRQAFGTEAARQRALSPTLHAAQPNVAEFLILHVERKDGIEQSEALAAALERNGGNAELGRFPGKGLRGHAEINRELGDPDYAATALVDRWLEDLFGR